MTTHRNSQKRFYDPDTVYFVTSKVHDNQPVFNESTFADLFIAELRLCCQLKGFSLYSFCLLPDHFHLLLKPGDACNISQIMKLLKGNISRDINYLIFGHCNMEGDTSMCCLPIRWVIRAERERLLKRFPRPERQFSLFRWQKSFHDHTIRSERDYQYHYRYTAYNFRHHNLPENWCYTSLNYPEMID